MGLDHLSPGREKIHPGAETEFIFPSDTFALCLEQADVFH